MRDLLLGREPADLDIVTGAPPEAVVALFDRTIPIGAEFGVVAVVIDGHPYQVATFRREGPYVDGRRPTSVEFTDAAADVARRDFTINALLYDPIGDIVIDHVGGRADLERRCIRTVGDPASRFAEDHLRLLRAVRLAAELGFDIEPATFAAITALAPAVTGVSAERVRDELLRLLVATGRADGIRLLGRTGLLAAILPEVPGLGEELASTGLALQALRRPTAALAAATLLHRLDAASTVPDICRRLRLSNADTRRIATLVADYRRLRDLPQMERSRARRLLSRDDAADLIELHRVDCLARGDDLGTYYLAAEMMAAGAGAEPPKLLSGNDLIALGYVPGPHFTEMLNAIEEARAGGQITSPDEARLWILARFPAGASSRSVEPSGGAVSDPHRGG